MSFIWILNTYILRFSIAICSFTHHSTHNFADSSNAFDVRVRRIIWSRENNIECEIVIGLNKFNVFGKNMSRDFWYRITLGNLHYRLVISLENDNRTQYYIRLISGYRRRVLNQRSTYMYSVEYILLQFPETQ